ncbi:hypothetical protein SAE02_77210 [Skermanella aerolata]|uniref:Uncharacterized protein n=1 Tax=Skermanella aerolata TaxID=393310 RepID=A0A512E4B2_9PROT|nr:hypothetical protein SAE02_77210 [Skermanella aerolata]
MPHRHRLFQERLADLNYQWQIAPQEARPSIERSMLLIIAMEESILLAKERAEIAEQRLARAKEILRRLDRRD